MTTIPHRELRNNSSEILRRVAAGESFEITNHGVVVARLSPPGPMSALDRLRAEGKVREAVRPIDWSLITPVELDVSTEEILRDLRGDR